MPGIERFEPAEKAKPSISIMIVIGGPTLLKHSVNRSPGDFVSEV